MRTRGARHSGNDAEEAMGAQPGAGTMKGAFVPADEREQVFPNSPAVFLPAIHSFVNGCFSTNKFSIYFQQVAGGR